MEGRHRNKIYPLKSHPSGLLPPPRPHLPILLSNCDCINELIHWSGHTAYHPITSPESHLWTLHWGPSFQYISWEQGRHFISSCPMSNCGFWFANSADCFQFWSVTGTLMLVTVLSTVERASLKMGEDITADINRSSCDSQPRACWGEGKLSPQCSFGTMERSVFVSTTAGECPWFLGPGCWDVKCPTVRFGPIRWRISHSE
jgi:hypothetical protein